MAGERSQQKNEEWKRDQLANYVGAALLMPIDQVYAFLEENDFKGASTRKRIKLIDQLCKRYDVSRITALRRVEEVYSVKTYRETSG